jgi:hypothetical protein
VEQVPIATGTAEDAMKVVVLIKASESSEKGIMPSEQLLRDMTAYNEELVKAGIMKDGEGLHPSSKGVRVIFDGNRTTVVDGPFAETKELVAGFWMWEVESMDEAVRWARRIPNTDGEHGVVEIRPVFEAADFGEAFTPELQERQARMRRTLAANE